MPLVSLKSHISLLHPGPIGELSSQNCSQIMLTVCSSKLLGKSSVLRLRLETDDFRLDLTDFMTVTVLIRHFQLVEKDEFQYQHQEEQNIRNQRHFQPDLA